MGQGLLYAFKKVKNEISRLKNPYLDTENAFLTHLEAKIWRNRISEGSSGFQEPENPVPGVAHLGPISYKDHYTHSKE